MSRRLRLLVPALLAVLVVVAGLLLGGVLTPDAGPDGTPVAAGTGEPASVAPVEPSPTPVPTPTPRPGLGGTELYGYVPYWQMTGSMASYLQSSPVSTLLLFSVTARRSGELNMNATGYRRITGPIGAQLIDDAHRRKARVELVFSSFGGDRNARFFGRVIPVPTPSGAGGSELPAPGATPTAPLAPSPTLQPTPGPPPWRRTVEVLVELADQLGVDGINVDVELLDPLDRPAYGEFLAALRDALRARLPEARVTVATEAGQRGVANAATAAAAGVDRLFLMGYDYHWSGSHPGASSPVDRYDGMASLRRSIDAYVDAGVPRDRILLGLPLYGMRWRVAEPDRAAEVIGQGVTWIPSQHVAELTAKGFTPFRDDIEHVEYTVKADGAEYLLTYYDSPATLRPKLALARDNGLAGAGFWALGYERGLPGYLELMRDFRDGKIAREASPPRY